ncbi:MAG: signal peptide peptidase SppA [Bacteroidales bacterium]|nr:signal peptide peptidase SppA [Bacteroidales bacterium]
MKQFFKMLLAVICGILIANIFVFMIIAAIAGSASETSGKGSKVLPRTGVLTIDLSEVTITEQEKPADPMAMVQGQNQVTLGLFKAVQAINFAATDPGVKFIYLKSDVSATGISELGELRTALENFRRSGKAIVAWTESPGVGNLYLNSVADKIYMSEYQGADGAMVGLCSQSFYLKDLLDKAGINMQLIRHGKYKSAGEMFVRNSPSEENKEQYNRMVASMWESIGGAIAESRNLPLAELDRMINNLELCMPEDFLKAGLVDAVLTRDSLKHRLAALAVEKDFKDVKFIPFADYANAKVVPNFRAKAKIAVLYADGEIVDGKGLENVAGDRFAKEIDKIRADKGIKAVVLRVNSPGGSVLASEKIKHELDLLGEEIPLIASYGSLAASGGYWISNNCSKIFSNPTTLTGSIGVFGMIPEASKTFKDVAHVGVFNAKSHKHADMMNLTRPFDQAEYNFMLRSIEAVYDTFTSIVAEGRGLEKKRVDEIGQGRVWTGADALEIGLVDEIGTLEDAINYAASSIGAEDVCVMEYPKPLTTMESLMASLGQTTEHDYVKAFQKLTEPRIIARMPYQVVVY